MTQCGCLEEFIIKSHFKNISLSSYIYSKTHSVTDPNRKGLTPALKLQAARRPVTAAGSRQVKHPAASSFAITPQLWWHKEWPTQAWNKDTGQWARTLAATKWARGWLHHSVQLERSGSCPKRMSTSKSRSARWCCVSVCHWSPHTQVKEKLKVPH